MTSRLTKDLEALYRNISVRKNWCQGTLLDRIDDSGCLLGHVCIITNLSPDTVCAMARLPPRYAQVINALYDELPKTWTIKLKGTALAWFNDHVEHEDVVALVKRALDHSRRQDQIDALTLEPVPVELEDA